MRRGAIVSVAAPGSYGKHRPAVVIQCDSMTAGGLESIILCLISSHLVDAPAFRIPVEPDSQNGLRVRSQIMTDKILTVPRSRIGKEIGTLDDQTLVRLNRTLAFVMGLG